MSITPDEAARALQDVDQARKQIGILSGYRYGAGHFLLWGVLWAACYLGQYFYPAYGSIIIGVANAIGALGSVAMILRARRRGHLQTGFAWRSFALLATIFLFIAAEYAVFSPLTQNRAAALAVLTMGMVYMQMGIWIGTRFLVVGAALTIVAVGGYFLMRDFYLIWIGLAGGGALILTGLWLRKA